MFIATLFTMAQTWKQPRCPSAGEWIKMWYFFFQFSFPWLLRYICQGIPKGLSGKETACNAGDTGLIFMVQEDPLEMEMATYSSILAWEIPWTEEPGGL